ncbi:MAG: hypothetical protein HOQ32_01910 [Lysobacter sp.]|nr:hypothetical protein [Lysobacter sp.]
MLGEVIKAGGGSYLIFAVVFALGLYAVRGVFSVHGRRGQHRKEFLELWADGHPRDALWLQVAVRHMYGEHLPAPVIRLALARPDSSRSLVDLSELWELLEYDGTTQKVRWRQKRHSTSTNRRLMRIAVRVAYFLCAFAGAIGTVVSAHYGPGNASGWIYGLFAAVMFGAAFVCIMREETIAIAARSGDIWVGRINRAAIRARKRRNTKAGD